MCFDDNTEDYNMIKSHQYYYQIQFQMYVTGFRYGFFVIYTSCDSMYLFVPYDAELLDIAVPKAEMFYIKAIMPELLGGHFYAKAKPLSKPIYDTQTFLLPCYCQNSQQDNSSIVYCSDENCRKKIFHRQCIYDRANNVRVRINNAWKCDICKKQLRVERAKARKTIP